MLVIRLSRFLTEALIHYPESLELLVVQFFQIEHEIAGTFGYSDQFIEFEVQGLGIAVLGILNKKYHKKSHDRRARIDHQLPAIAVLE